MEMQKVSSEVFEKEKRLSKERRGRTFLGFRKEEFAYVQILEPMECAQFKYETERDYVNNVTAFSRLKRKLSEGDSPFDFTIDVVQNGRDWTITVKKILKNQEVK